MKRLIFFILVVSLALPFAMSGHDFQYTYQGQTLWYTVLDEDAKTCATKAGYDFTPGNQVSGYLVIPATAKDGEREYSVTSIGYKAFYECSGLTEVTIPNSVTSIGFKAFYGCSGLTEVTIPNSVSSIGDYAFNGCSSLIFVYIPKSISSIGDKAFYGCSNLAYVLYDATEPINIGGYFYSETYNEATLYVPEVAISECRIIYPWDFFWDRIFPYEFSQDNLNFRINPDGEVTLVSPPQNSYKGNIVIPSSVTYQPSLAYAGREFPVTSIADDAFYDCYNLISVEIPNSVTSIGSRAFYGCSYVRSISIPNSVTSIGDYAFYGCSGLTSVTIPDSVTSIGSFTFSGCSGLTSVSIPNSVTSIGLNAFQDCSGLTSITIPNSVTSIGWHAFSGCSGLSSVYYDATKPIEADSWCFSYDTYRNATLYVPAIAIEQCKQIDPWQRFNKIEASDLVQDKLNYEFNDDGTATLIASAGEQYSGEIVIPSTVTRKGQTYTVTSIGDYAFKGCTGLSLVEIPISVTSIGYKSLYGCSGLSTITIPTEINSIGDYAFYGCSSLAKVYYESTEPIRAHIFCFSPETYSNAILYVPSVVIEKCQQIYPWKKFSNIEASDLVQDILNYQFNADGTATVIASAGEPYSGEIVIPSTVIHEGKTYTVTSIGSQAFFRCSGLTSVTIGKSVTSIGLMAFKYCTGLTNVTIGNSVTYIGGGAFDGCSGLTEVTLGNSVTTIDGYAFKGCASLTEINIPNSVTFIGEEAFYNCSGLSEITIPRYVTSIGDNAFNGCSGLTSVNYYATEPIEASSNCFYSKTYSNASLYVPVVAIEKCRQIYPWKNFNIIEAFDLDQVDLKYEYNDDGTATVIASAGNPYSGDIVIPSTVIHQGKTYTVTSIGDKAFYGCSALTSITIPNSVTSIGYVAFYRCPELTSVTIPSSVTSIDRGAFFGCSGLTSITIPSSVSYIGWQVFDGCSGLTSVYYDATEPIEADRDCFSYDTYRNVTLFVPEVAIEKCRQIYPWKNFNKIEASDLDQVDLNYEYNDDGTATVIASEGEPYSGDIVIPSTVIHQGKTYTVTSIGVIAFYGCTGLTSVTIPNSVTSIGNSAFSDCYGLTSVTIPSSVTYIGSGAFYDCSGLTSISIPNSVISIDYGTFYGCSGLTEVTIPNSITYIGPNVFYGCSGLTEITIPDSVNFIGDSAFYNCNGLRTVTIGNSVTSIGNDTFYGCSGMTELTIGSSVTSIKYNAFSKCTSLKYLTINDGEETLSLNYNYYYDENYGDIIKNGLFSDCPLEKLYLGRNLSYEVRPYHHYVPFYNQTKLTSITIGRTVTSISDYAFSNCSGLTEVTIPNSVTSIGDYAFFYCSGLTEVNIGNSVTSISDYAFSNCSGLTEVTIPNSVTSIGDYAFSGSSGLTEVNIGETVSTIGVDAFLGCYKLTSLTIPKSVTSIGNNAFWDCSGLNSVYYDATEPIEASSNCFSSKTYSNATLYVPVVVIEKCRQTNPWKNFQVIKPKEISGIDEIEIDYQESEVTSESCEVYNLNGIKIANSTKGLAPGIYIVRKGSTTSKIVIK